MDIEELVKKHFDRWVTDTEFGNVEVHLRAALTEQAETHALELRAYEATVQNLEQRIRELESQRVPDGWKGWRDVYVHGCPEAAQEVLFARGGITVHGAFIGGIFWHSNEKCAAALWMPLPTPLTPDEHRAMLAAAPLPQKEPRHD